MHSITLYNTKMPIEEFWLHDLDWLFYDIILNNDFVFGKDMNVSA